MRKVGFLCLEKSKEDIWCSGTEVIDWCWLLSESREPNLDPLQKQQIFFTAEPSIYQASSSKAFKNTLCKSVVLRLLLGIGNCCILKSDWVPQRDFDYISYAQWYVANVKQ